MTYNAKTFDKKIKKEIKTGNVKSAIELCQIGLQKDPNNPDLHLLSSSINITAIF